MLKVALQELFWTLSIGLVHLSCEYLSDTKLPTRQRRYLTWALLSQSPQRSDGGIQATPELGIFRLILKSNTFGTRGAYGHDLDAF